jgi:hypothetical protein
MDWLLDSDPAIRWQVLKDILHEKPAAYEQERSKLTQNGWCAQLLQFQDASGLWNHSLYTGKWLSTTYSLYLLKILGLSPGHPQAVMGCEQLLTQGLYQNQEIRFSRNQDISDQGVSALVLSLVCYFGYDVEALHRLASFLIDQQCDPGNWLPNGAASAADYTFETTLLVLEALLQYENRYAAGDNTPLSRAVQKGQNFLLGHNLGLSEQKPVKAQWISFSFPPYWFYDILTALDYFYSFGMNHDSRMQMAIDLLRHKQTRTGTWLSGSRHPGKTYFDMEKPPGEPSRWNTLRALRVLNWWNDGVGSSQ